MQSGYFLIADISGYTEFVQLHTLKQKPLFGKFMAKNFENHASIIISDLLESVIEAIEPSMKLHKLEGDAAFFYIEENSELDQADKIISAMGLSRNNIYISNIVKYRPKIGDGRQGHSNRKPTSDEMSLSIKYILDEIEIIKPKLIVTLGGTATKGLLGLDEPISSLRGKVHDINHCKAIVTYHPSYLLRSKNPNQDKRLVWEDMLMAMDFLKMTISSKQKNYFK